MKAASLHREKDAKGISTPYPEASRLGKPLQALFARKSVRVQIRQFQVASCLIALSVTACRDRPSF